MRPLMVGAKLVLPGPRLDGASLQGLIEAEGVTMTAGVPTVWMALLDWVRPQGRGLGIAAARSASAGRPARWS